MARAAWRDTYGAVGPRGERVQLMRKEHLWEVGACCQAITGIEKLLWGALGLRIPGYLRDMEELLKTGGRVVWKPCG